MSFTFTCPHCNQKLEAEDEWIGQQASCPGCRKEITIEKTSTHQGSNDAESIDISQTSTEKPRCNLDSFYNFVVMLYVKGIRWLKNEKIRLGKCYDAALKKEEEAIKTKDIKHEKKTDSSDSKENKQTPDFGETKQILNDLTDSQKTAETPTAQLCKQQHQQSGLSVSSIGNGKFAVIGNYSSVWFCVIQALKDCACNISLGTNPYSGEIVAKFKPSAITVSCFFYTNGDTMIIEFAAICRYYDMGLCAKKISEISEHFSGLASTYKDSDTSSKDFPQTPPDFTQRARLSYVEKAKAALVFGLFGIILGPLAFMGINALIFGFNAIRGMKFSNNYKGSWIAILGIILGGIDAFIIPILFDMIIMGQFDNEHDFNLKLLWCCAHGIGCILMIIIEFSIFIGHYHLCKSSAE